MERWKCSVCGYIHKGSEPPQKCPVCGADRGKFVPLDDDSSTSPPSSAESSAAAQQDSVDMPDKDSETVMKRWQCTVCGYIHNGPEPPEKCPVCGAPKSKFIELRDELEPHNAGPKEQLQDAQKEEIEPGQEESRRSRLQELLVKFHAHPIAVHIPNGVLPLTVLFCFLAAAFNSPSLSSAAKWNTIFITLSMPLVILTGLNDWQKRFEMRMSRVFLIKMVCAGIVSLLSASLSVWWLTQPDILINQSADSGFFLFLYIIDFVAAAVAGWYGGKLVFPNNS